MRTIIRNIVVLVIAVNLSCIAYADDGNWVSTGKTDESTNIEMLYNTLSFEDIAPNVHRILVREARINPNRWMGSSPNVLRLEYPADIDCRQRRWKMYPETFYLTNGQMHSKPNVGVVAYQEIKSGTLADELRKAVCLDAFRRKQQ